MGWHWFLPLFTEQEWPMEVPGSSEQEPKDGWSWGGLSLAISHTYPGQAWHCPQYSGGSINLLDKRARNWGEEMRRANPRAWGSGGNWTASTNWEDGFRTTACIKDHKTFPVCGTKRHPGVVSEGEWSVSTWTVGIWESLMVGLEKIIKGYWGKSRTNRFWNTLKYLLSLFF